MVKMKRTMLAMLLIVAWLMPTSILADSYSSLWKQLERAIDKDQPKTELAILQKIAHKATIERAYGHLLKAQIKAVSVRQSLSPDSLRPSVIRLEGEQLKAEKAGNKVLAAVYAAVLGRAYDLFPKLCEDVADAEAASKQWYDKSLRHPDALAKAFATGYEPFVIDGVDSRIFGDDLLHIIGFQAGRTQFLHDYYEKAGNRQASCITALSLLREGKKEQVAALRKSKYLLAVDSLLNEYKDLMVAGEVAIERYNVMAEANDVNPKDMMNFIDYSLVHWGAWPRMNILRNAQSRLTLPSFHVAIGDDVLLPGVPRKVNLLSVVNVNELTMTVRRVNIDGDTTLDPAYDKEYAKLKAHFTADEHYTQTRRYIGMPAYKATRDSMTINPLKVGVYVVEFSTNNAAVRPERVLLRVSNLKVVCQSLPNHKQRFAVLNATTGQPVPGAKLRISTRRFNVKTNLRDVSTHVFDAKGEVIIDLKGKENYITYYAYTDDDKASMEGECYYGYHFYGNDRTAEPQLKLFTDRALYRPGQTVQLSAIAFSKSRNGASTMPNEKVTFKLRNASGKNVSTAEAMTDKYGTATTSFVLPTSGLNGTFSIRASVDGQRRVVAWNSIRVEEYKRPTFDITFAKPSTSYQAGDTVSLSATARTYSGVAVQGAKVLYRVVRRPALWWGRFGVRDRTTLLYADTAVTDGSGRFVARVPMTMPEREDGFEKVARFYSFDVTATVTDAGGESHDASATVPLGDKSTALSCTMPDKIERDSLHTIRFNYTNAAGEPLDGEVTYYIDDQRFTARTNSNQPLSAVTLTSASHLLTAYCGSDTIQQHFVLFSMQDKKVATHTHDWFYTTANRFPANGQPVYVQVGSSDSVQHVLYTIFSGEKVLESDVLNLKDGEVMTRCFTYKPEYGDGLLLTYVWVKEGEVYRHEVKIACPKPDNRLTTTWTTFRDRLTPGQKEEWTLHIATPDGSAAKAQAMLTMYDKSLDQLLKHRWTLSADWVNLLPSTRWDYRDAQTLSRYGEMAFRPLGERALDFSSFYMPWIVAKIEKHGEVLKIRGSKKQLLRASSTNDKVFNYVPNEEMEISNSMLAKMEKRTITGAVKEDSDECGDAGEHGAADKVNVRENLSETAFFMPTLETDDKGNVKVKFTLPESVTTWRLMGIAHDTNMRIGQLEAEAVAQKKLMIEPNLPRFVRPADKGSIVARLSNLSERRLGGTARLELLNPETNKTVYAKDLKFKIEKDTTIALCFALDMAHVKNDGLLICRVSAQAAGFSDGEQRYLPVLSASEQVTTAVPFTQQGAGTKTIDLKPLFSGKTVDEGKLTVEYTNNPAWLMVQTLPSVSTRGNEDAISLATAYYTNVVGRKLMTLSPAIQQTVEQWKLNADKHLKSTLADNEEVKNILLSETPWADDAENETDNMRRLASFYDANTLDMRQAGWLAKLETLQKYDGSFSWWPGMMGSKHVTVSVAETLARLASMDMLDNEGRSILKKAVNWLGSEASRECNDMRKREQKGEKHVRPSEFACEYMYVCALTGARNSMTLKRQTDYDYLIAHLAKQNADLSIEGKARAAVVLAEANHKTEANTLIESMRQYLVSKPDMGSYYDTHKAGYSWRNYRIPTQVAAIEALQRLQPSDQKTIADMQLWLLQCKRTQGWDTPLSTVDAVSAFLGGNAKSLTASEGKPTVLKVDGKQLNMPKQLAGLGYVKTTKEGNHMRTFTAEKSTDGTSWGAVYAQYVQPLEEVEKASAGIAIKRTFYKDGKRIDVTNTAEGNKVLNDLKVGDRLTVRLTIDADRDYDFVQVSDHRAANMEPTSQLSGYRNGSYMVTRDNATYFFFDRLAKGRHTIEASYYIDRAGAYRTGLCTAQCAYSPEFMARDVAVELESE